MDLIFLQYENIVKDFLFIIQGMFITNPVCPFFNWKSWMFENDTEMKPVLGQGILPSQATTNSIYTIIICNMVLVRDFLLLKNTILSLVRFRKSINASSGCLGISELTFSLMLVDFELGVE